MPHDDEPRDVNDETWTHCARWRDRWAEVVKLGGGGQGNAYRACRASDGREACLKVIKSMNDAERRMRFFREAAAYDTIRAARVPRLIESNAHLHGRAEVEPYIATEFIVGETLRKWRNGRPGVDLGVAVQMTRSLLATLRECHAQDVVHRDVKPDNIILADDDPARPVLLDFGLNFHRMPDVEFATDDRQEIGNRFLRLPELSAGSLRKQDPSSDLSFAAGILFYVLTGRNPDILQDAEGRLPHQRSEVLAILESAVGARLPRLLSLFDHAFARRIADRFTTADAMLARLDQVMEPRPLDSGTPEDDLNAIRELMDTQATRRRSERVKRLNDALNQIQRVHDDTRKLLGVPMSRRQTGFHVTGDLGRNTLGWVMPGSDDDVLSVKCEVREVGDELVIRLSGEPVFRTSTETPRYGDRFDEVVRSWLIARSLSAVADPDALPSESGLFGDRPPIGSLEQARVGARRERRHILAFVYDPTQPKRGKLGYCLGYFLDNRKTRETINAAFVVALVELSQVVAVTDILNNKSMESPRWVVFDPDLQAKQQAVIYANPQEGEKIACDLATRYGS